VVSHSPVLSILVLSEDSGADGRRTVKALLERILLSWHGHQRVLSIDAQSQGPAAAHANLWRSTKGSEYQRAVTFIRRLATELAKGAFVVFHYDGDTAWAGREDALTPKQFQHAVRNKLSHFEPKLGQAERKRLIELVPHYSVEAWAYQATEHAVHLCEAQYEGRDVEVFQTWAADRARLDEELRPKERTVLRAKHNTELMQHLRASEVVAIGKSLAHFVRLLEEHEELAELLREEVREQLPPAADGKTR
jgi:hypothetical protein